MGASTELAAYLLGLELLPRCFVVITGLFFDIKYPQKGFLLSSLETFETADRCHFVVNVTACILDSETL